MNRRQFFKLLGEQYKNFVKYYKNVKRTNNKLRFYVDGVQEEIL